MWNTRDERSGWVKDLGTIIGQERIAAAIADLNRILSAVPDETTAPTP